MPNAASILEKSNLIIIKIGSVLIRGDSLDTPNSIWMDALAKDIAHLKSQNKKIIIVSSGGVALGRKALGISEKMPPSDIPLAKKQAASAVGQYHLFNGYYKAFAQYGMTAAQVLLTMSETENRRMHLNARETLHTLLDNDITPIINENDTVSTGEIRFGDNDRLSVRVAQMIGADSVILLSTINGLYTDNPDTNPSAKHIPIIEKLEHKHTEMAGDALAGLSTGGMKSKIEAANSATKTGIDLIITDGRDNNSLAQLFENADKLSSLFLAQKKSPNARKTWLGAHMSPKGKITIDAGALNALNSGRSLLPVGITTIEGAFRRGDVIEIIAPNGKKIGTGIAAYNADDATRIKGKNSAEIPTILGYISQDEMVHRNDMVLDI